MPDNIPPEVFWPLFIGLWLLLLFMILRDRRRLSRALKERPTLKIYNRVKGEWVTAEHQELFDQDEVVEYAKADLEKTKAIFIGTKKEAAQ